MFSTCAVFVLAGSPNLMANYIDPGFICTLILSLSKSTSSLKRAVNWLLNEPKKTRKWRREVSGAREELVCRASNQKKRWFITELEQEMMGIKCLRKRKCCYRTLWERERERGVCVPEPLKDRRVSFRRQRWWIAVNFLRYGDCDVLRLMSSSFLKSRP